MIVTALCEMRRHGRRREWCGVGAKKREVVEVEGIDKFAFSSRAWRRRAATPDKPTRRIFRGRRRRIIIRGERILGIVLRGRRIVVAGRRKRRLRILH